jgi:hypothetical protein
LRISAGSSSHAAITDCKPASSDDRHGQTVPPECSARAASRFWQLAQGEADSPLGSNLQAGSNPVGLAQKSDSRRWTACGYRRFWGAPNPSLPRPNSRPAAWFFSFTQVSNPRSLYNFCTIFCGFPDFSGFSAA